LEAERASLWWAACHDELTGLANRRLFCTLAPPLLRAGRPAVLVVLDLNGFKPINDTLGHDVGDLVLQTVARRMTACARHTVVARLGGDEFASVLASPQHEPSPHWWRPAVATLAATIAEPMPVADHQLSVTASVGVAPAHDEVLITELIRRADLAMYHAKANGHCYAAWDGYAVDGAHTPDSVQRRGARPQAIAPARRDLRSSAGPRIVEAVPARPGRGGPRRYLQAARSGLGLSGRRLAAGRGRERLTPGRDGDLPERGRHRNGRGHHDRRVRPDPPHRRSAARPPDLRSEGGRLTATTDDPWSGGVRRFR
jgi:diguanylate cyclase (GGDEF)-like protein